MFVCLFHQHIYQNKDIIKSQEDEDEVHCTIAYIVSYSQADSWQWPYTNNNT